MALSLLKPHAYGVKTELAMDINKDLKDADDIPVIHGTMFPTNQDVRFPQRMLKHLQKKNELLGS